MPSLGIFCHDYRGHLNPMLTLARELRGRGHHITFFGLPDAESSVRQAGFDFEAFGRDAFPVGSLDRHIDEAGRLTGLAAVQCFSRRHVRLYEVLLRDARPLVEQAEFDLLLVDQDILVGGTVAETCGVPFVTVCLALMMNWGRDVPPWMMPWRYDTGRPARLRNWSVYAFMSLFRDRTWKLVDDFRRERKLPIHRRADAHYSRLAQISQQPAEFEFPRRLPACFHFAGPFFRAGERVQRPFPWERLDGRPLVYASLGTLQNGLPHVFDVMARACRELDVQLVISLNRTGDRNLGELPGLPLVVEHAPQQELLARAELAITHAGMNTVLEALSYGVPMVALPITNDQPGIAARLAWSGAGEVVPPSRLSVRRLRSAVQRVLADETYAQNAMRLKEAIAGVDGVARAADIIEQVLATGAPVLSPFYAPSTAAEPLGRAPDRQARNTV